MADKSTMTVRSVLENHDFREFNTIGEGSGGQGHLLYAVLAQSAGVRDVLFDLPQVIERARGRAHPRVEYVSEKFFFSTPCRRANVA